MQNHKSTPLQVFYSFLIQLSHNLSLFIVLFSLEPFLRFFNNSSATGLPIIIFVVSTFLALLCGNIAGKYLRNHRNNYYLNGICLFLAINLLPYTRSHIILFSLWIIYTFTAGLLFPYLTSYLRINRARMPNLASLIPLVAAILALIILRPLYPYITNKSRIFALDAAISPQTAWIILFSAPLILQFITIFKAKRLFSPSIQPKLENLISETNSSKTPKNRATLLFLVFLFAGTLIILLSLLYLPSFLSLVGKLEVNQSKDILYYALCLAIPMLCLVFWGVWRWGKWLLWLGILAMILGALVYKPILDQVLALLNPKPSTELVDKRTENIKNTHFFSSKDRSKYLYTIRKVSSKNYYDNGLILSTTRIDTLETGMLRMHIGKIPNSIQKKIGGQLSFIIAVLLAILISLALLILVPLNFCFFSLNSISLAIPQKLILGILASIITIASAHLADPKLGYILGINGILTGIYTVIILLTVSAVIGAYLLWQEIPIIKRKPRPNFPSGL